MHELQLLDIIKKGDQFTKAHVLLALQLISSELILGRYEIEKNLELTNSTARILLIRLVEHKLIKAIKRRGHCLTDLGKKLLKKIEFSMPYNAPISIPTLIQEPSYAVQFRNIENYSSNGIIERDMAVRYGAKGGITIIVKNKTLKMPGVVDSLEEKYPEFANQLSAEFPIEQGNLIFITFGESKIDIAVAALMVGFSLLENK